MQLYIVIVWFRGFPFQFLRIYTNVMSLNDRRLLSFKGRKILRLLHRNSPPNFSVAYDYFLLRRTRVFFTLLSCNVTRYTLLLLLEFLMNSLYNELVKTVPILF